jgi:4-hydroxy-4-methyl-2-oxoglutarate aldolase
MRSIDSGCAARSWGCAQCGRVSGSSAARSPSACAAPSPAAIEAGGPGEVIVIEHHQHDQAAGWGGILSLAARTKGVEGVIVDGLCRDVDDSRDAGFPVYARAATPMTARGRILEDSMGEPIDVGGVRVEPGDLVIADWSGVVFVSAARAEEIIATAETLAAREAQMADAVRAGQSVVDVMGASYESMTRQ